MTHYYLLILQVIVALGLLNVWLLRANSATSYRGGEAKTLREEFAVYGLPGWFCTLVGILKISCAVSLILGGWIPEVILPAGIMLSALMLGAVSMHVKVQDPLKKMLPAAAMLCMSISIVMLSY